jgi:hypothetical protein
MKWAAFEETIGSIDEAKEILRQLVAKYPMLLEARYRMHSHLLRVSLHPVFFLYAVLRIRNRDPVRF